MHDLRHPRLRYRSARCLTGAVLLLPTLGCVMGEGVLGEYTETDVGTSTGDGEGTADGSSGAPEPGCVEDCDPDFALSVIVAPNFALQPVYLLGDTTCDGPSCPATVSPAPIEGQAVEACLQSEAAQSSPLGAEEHCRLAPAWLIAEIELGFATPVDRSSFEEVRPQPLDAVGDEPYLWHADVVALHGPRTALRGDYTHGDSPDQPDRLTSVVNETCAQRLTALGIPWSPAQLEALCVGTWDDGGVLRPLKLDPEGTLTASAGGLSTWSGPSCDTPDAGPDTCCSLCDWVLGPAVARYGVSPGGARRNANLGTAIACDPDADVLVECRDLVLDVERVDDASYTYAWDGASQAWPLPRYDKLRETHPDDRPAGVEAVGPACTNASGCLDGQDCIGTNAAGDACTTGEDCVGRTCQAEWFGRCHLVPGGAAACVDRRFSDHAGACLVATSDFAGGSAGDRLAQCDANGDAQLGPAECCDPALGGDGSCDPLYQPGVVPVARYDRHTQLSPEGSCVCEEGQPESCGEAVDAWCEAPLGSGGDPGPDSPAGGYAVPMVTRLGGVRWDEERMLLSLRLATVGGVPRALVEACAEGRGLIGGRSTADGWMANSEFIPELLEDHDLALCSGSTYRLVFAESSAAHHVRSAGQGTLDGRSEHVFETPQLRIVPGSLFPNDELTIESCSDFSLRLSNRHDPSESNLRKLELREGAADGPVVAGGPGCDPLANPAEVAAGVIPCLTFDPSEDVVGTLSFAVDESIHGPVLQPGTTYFVVLPGLAHIDQLADTEAYAAAFHDACGMPLVVGDTPEQLALWELAFTVDASCS